MRRRSINRSAVVCELLLSVTVLSTHAGCRRESAADGDGSDDGSTSELGESGGPSPGAPDENCPGQLDPARVYVAMHTAELQSNTALVFPVDAPEEACAYLWSSSGSHLFVGVENGGLRFIGGLHDGVALKEIPQSWLERSSVSRYHVGGGSIGEYDVVPLGCAIGEEGTIVSRQRADGDLAFFCADGIGGSWFYDVPGDPEPLPTAEAQGWAFVTSLPANRFLLQVEEGVGLSVLQGDGQRIPVLPGGDLTSILPVAARATETGALVVGYAGHEDGSGGLELCELVGEQLTSIARYERGMEFDWPFYNEVPLGSEPSFHSALGADGTLGAVFLNMDAEGPEYRAVWMRPDTVPITAVAPDAAGEIDLVFDVFTQ